MKPRLNLLSRDVVSALLVIGALNWAWYAPRARGAEDAHEGHDHAEAATAQHDDHASDARPADPHAGHADEGEALNLTAEQRRRFGIEIREAGPGHIDNEVRLAGEVVFNEDRLVHLVPRVAGIARKVKRSVGDPVKAGDVLAVIDSADLASAKLNYFSAETEVGCCQFELPRAQAIHDNVQKMLTLLDGSPSVEELHEAAPGEMGEYRSRLIAAYAEYVLTRRAYEREQALLAKEISSEGDFLKADSAFKKAQAAYFGTRDSVAYEVRQNVLETSRDRQLSEFQAETAKQRLLMLGLSPEQVTNLATVQASGGDAADAGHSCTDPNCTDCQDDQHATSEIEAPGQARLGWYEIKSPFDGFIVQKHIALGERVGEDAEVFTIVDTDSVWVNLSVYTKDLAAVQRGQEVVLRADHSGAQARSEIAMVTPFVEQVTRSATARVVLDNHDRRWMPGTFVTGFISSSQEDLPLVVPRDAVQRIEGEDVVFVEHEGAFEATPVQVGRADRDHLEITGGLEPGTRYVAEGAFQLKATVITSNLDAHAGHGH